MFVVDVTCIFNPMCVIWWEDAGGAILDLQQHKRTPVFSMLGRERAARGFKTRTAVPSAPLQRQQIPNGVLVALIALEFDLLHDLLHKTMHVVTPETLPPMCVCYEFGGTTS